MTTGRFGFGHESLLLRAEMMPPGRAHTGSLCITCAACENWGTGVGRDAVPEENHISNGARSE
jgi:hypothetical protein